jgi:hypothetical protein
LLVGSSTPFRQAPGVLRAAAHVLAALQHQWLQAHLRQDERGKQAARPEAHHHRAQAAAAAAGRGLADDAVAGVGCGPQVSVARRARQHGRVVTRSAQGEVERVDELDIGLAPRVVAAAEDLDVADSGIGQPEPRQHRLAERRLRVVERQAQFGDAQHQVTLVRRR